MTPEQNQEEQQSPEEIRTDIEQTRRELGDTAAAVAEKADVKKQAKAKVDGTKERANAKVDAVKQSAAQKKDEVAGKAQEATPESAGAAAQQARHLAREHPIPIA